MSWEVFYLICFVVGFSLSALSFFSGMLHLPHFLHFPQHGGTLHLGGAHTGSAHAGGTPPEGSAAGYAISPLNFPTLLMFLVWFGATG